MRIDRDKEQQLREISEAAEKLESLLHQLWVDDGNRNSISLNDGAILTIWDRSTEEDREISLNDCSDFEPLKEAYLKA